MVRYKLPIRHRPGDESGQAHGVIAQLYVNAVCLHNVVHDLEVELPVAGGPHAQLLE